MNLTQCNKLGKHFATFNWSLIEILDYLDAAGLATSRITVKRILNAYKIQQARG